MRLIFKINRKDFWSFRVDWLIIKNVLTINLSTILIVSRGTEYQFRMSERSRDKTVDIFDLVADNFTV